MIRVLLNVRHVSPVDGVTDLEASQNCCLMLLRAKYPQYNTVCY